MVLGVEGLGRCLEHEDGTLMSDISVLIKKKKKDWRACFLSAFCPIEIEGEGRHLQTRIKEVTRHQF